MNSINISRLSLPLISIFFALLAGLLICIRPTLLFLFLIPPLLLSCRYPKLWYFVFLAIIPIEYFLKDMFSPFVKGVAGIAIILFFYSCIRENGRIIFDKPFLFMVLFSLWGTISIFWSKDTNYSIIFLSTYVSLSITYLMIINQKNDEKNIKIIFCALTIGGIGLFISGINEIFAKTYTTNLERVRGATNDQNYYFLLSIFLIPAFFGVIQNSRKLWQKILLSLILLGLLTTALYTKSRAGLIVLIIFFIINLVFQKRKILWSVFFLIMIILTFVFIPMGYIDRFKTMQTDEFSRITVIWPTAFNTLLKNPLLGYGIGNGTIVLAKSIKYPSYYHIYAQSPHNVYLGIGLDLGIPGLILYLLFMIYPTLVLIKKIFKLRNLSNKYDFLYQNTILLLSIMICYFVYIYQGGGMETRKILWVLLGMEVILSRIIEERLAFQKPK